MSPRRFRQLAILLLLTACTGMVILRSRGTLPVTILGSWKEEKHAEPVRPIVYDVPKVASPEPFDGEFDWKQPAFRVEAMHPDRLSRKDGTLAAAASMAWTPEGFLLMIRVHGQPHRVRDPACLNSSEANFDFSLGTGDEGGYRVTVRDPDLPEARLLVFGKDDGVKPLVKMTRRTETDGYSIKLLAPLPAKASNGLRLQVAVATTDGKTLDALRLWEPCAPEDEGRLPLLRPADNPSASLLAASSCHPALLSRQENYLAEVAKAHAQGRTLHDLVVGGTTAAQVWDGMLSRSGYRIALVSSVPLKGRPLAVVDDRGTRLASLTATGDKQEFLVPKPTDRNSVSFLSVYVDGTKLTDCVPSFERSRAAIGTSTPVDVIFDSYAFDGQRFPEPLVADPIRARWAMGAFGLSVRYFDSTFRSVAVPSSNGRYGAVATVLQGGKTLSTQYGTLAYRVPRATIAGPEIPRMPADERQALYALSSKAASSPNSYAAFDENQAWWLGLREKLGIDLPWVVVLPKDYESKPLKKWPLVLYLHGGGAQDLEGLRPRVEMETVTQVAKGEIGPFKGGDKAPFILIDPLLSVRDLRWTPALVDSVLRQTERNYRIDRRRVVLMGHSAGASGALRVASAIPHRFSAMLLLSFDPDPTVPPESLKGLPTWFFVGEKDASSVPMDRLVRSIKSFGGKSRLTVLKKAEHYIPPLVYPREDIWQWALGTH